MTRFSLLALAGPLLLALLAPTPITAGPRGLEDLPAGAPVDPSLQAALEEIDARVRAELQIAGESRALGIAVLEGEVVSRLAWLRPDAIFYGASVPKICILAAYLEKLEKAGEELTLETRRELELVIKRSSNELAAKYSQLAGLEAIQALQTSPLYRLYEASSGGGLWCGKHYGKPAPRTPDAVGGYSHAFTVRQALRFYLLMEQGQLVSPGVCRQMREIFQAPRLEFHDDNFVRGLRGRNVRVIRKNGLWEDWHLDTARVEGEGRVYLLAGAVRHARGQDYLAHLARELDRHLGGPDRPLRGHHELIVHSVNRETLPVDSVRIGKAEVSGGVIRIEADPASRSGKETIVGEYLTPEFRTSVPFNELLPSWNVKLRGDAVVTFELSTRPRGGEAWTPFLHVGDWRDPDLEPAGWLDLPRRLEAPGSKILTDFLRTERRQDQFKMRVRLLARPGSEDVRLEIHRLAFCVSDRTGLPLAFEVPTPERAPRLEEVPWKRRLPVPFRSQKVERAEIAGRICSPTSVSMVMEFLGVDRPTGQVAREVYDHDHDIYGNWPRAIQTAFHHGVPGYLARFADWGAVRDSIAAGKPLIISIAVKEGQLEGAPYRTTAGHLLVLTGFDEKGDVHVNDPASSTVERGVTVYRRADLEQVWMARGGTAYVLGR